MNLGFSGRHVTRHPLDRSQVIYRCTVHRRIAALLTFTNDLNVCMYVCLFRYSQIG